MSSVQWLLIVSCVAAAQQTHNAARDNVTSSQDIGFQNNSIINLSVQQGYTAFLTCNVPKSKEKTIMWLRSRDWHIISSGLTLHASDDRFQIFHKEGSNEWVLQLKYVQERDGGLYECQVSSHFGVSSLFANLTVLVPRAVIYGNSDYHIERGSSISLKCVIEKAIEKPGFVLWSHGHQVLNYVNTDRVKVSTEHTPAISSELKIERIQEGDSGNYTCSAQNTKPAMIRLFVSQGDKIAAIQRRNVGMRTLSSSLMESFLLMLLSLVHR